MKKLNFDITKRNTKNRVENFKIKEISNNF